MATVQIHGHQGRQGETAFAFCVFRFRDRIDHRGVVQVLRYVAPLLPDPDAVLEDLLARLEEAVRWLCLPWRPPDVGHLVDAQRRLIESAGAIGVEAAWFFQTGTSLDLDDAEDRAADDAEWRDEDVGSVTSTQTLAIGDVGPTSLDQTYDLDLSSNERAGSISALELTFDEPLLPDEVGEAEAGREGTAAFDGGWTNGPPPQVDAVRFPIDDDLAVLGQLDGESIGIAFKLAGGAEPGEANVLLGFHALWLAPYAGSHAEASIAIDRTRHAARLWVDRLAVPCSREVVIRHLLWIVSKIDEVIPILRARFVWAPPEPRVDRDGEPFILGGNPLLAAHASGGAAAVDAWLASVKGWSQPELAEMLRELALVLAGRAVGEASEHGDDEADGDDDDGDDDDDDDGDDDEHDDEHDDDQHGDDDDDGEAEGNEDEDHGRHITGFASELLRARAAAGKLDPRVAARLLPVLDEAGDLEQRRRVVEILGAIRHAPAVPAMIRILEHVEVEHAVDAIGRDELLSSTAAALGAIADPSAIPALAKLVAAPGRKHDKPRPAVADALASCLAVTPEPRDVDDAVLAALLATIRERNDGELNAEAHVAYGRLARQLRTERRAEASRRLAASETARDDATAALARHAALVLASAPLGMPSAEVRSLLHECLTGVAYDHDATVRELRIALRVADVLRELVDPDDLRWLTRFAEPDLRRRAHELLAVLGHPLPEAAAHDRRTARALDDDALVRAISEPHVIGRAALIAEAARRELGAARRVIVAACEDVRSRARRGSAGLLDPDARVLEAALPLLCESPLDAETVALLDRLLRHSNPHVKWALLEAPPRDERLIGGMFHVLRERWGWQEVAARAWLEGFQGSPAYDQARRHAGSPTLDEEVDDRDIN
jgi:hypothetical protein